VNNANAIYLATQQFLAHEARLLDESRWSEWLELFAPGAIYWMPLDPTQTDHLGHASLLCDDAVLRELRCRRWDDRASDTGALSLQPTPRTNRHLSNLTVAADTTGASITARGNVILAEFARAEVRVHYAHALWRLVHTADTFLIAEKRVDLLNASGHLSDILSYL
jgi:3-phenylpropionate/cinnamic acid dioxygenase small subunit